MGSELGQDHGTWKVSLMVWRCESRNRDSSPPPAAFFPLPPFFDIAAAVAVARRDREEEGGASGEEPTGTRDGAAAVDGFMRLGLGLLDVGVARAVKNRIKIRARKCFLSPAKRESEECCFGFVWTVKSQKSSSCSILKLVDN